MNNRSRLLACLLLLILSCPLARLRAEEPTRAYAGMNLDLLKNSSAPALGWMAGAHGVAYLGDSDYFLGMELTGGTSRGGSLERDELIYGGLLAGVDGAIATGLTYRLSVLTGIGNYQIADLGQNGTTLALQPTFESGISLAEDWRMMVSIGYLYLYHAGFASGPIIGFRIDHDFFAIPHG